MYTNVSFIGAGNMGGAIIKAVCQALTGARVFVAEPNRAKGEELARNCGCQLVADNAAAVRSAEYIFLCVKPQVLPTVLKELAPVLNAELEQGRALCLVSIAAGVQIASIREKLSGKSAQMPIVRIMPNMTVSVGKGMLAITTDGIATAENLGDVKEILSKAGRIDELGEGLMDQFTAISGCLPAYVFMLIEALADGAVITGLPRAQAMEYAAQTIAGSAEMFLQGGGQHPGAMKDAVCSPAGSTIAGLAALERNGFRNAAIEAIVEAYKRNIELGK